MKQVKHYEEPLRELTQVLDDFSPEMSKWESSFLSGLLKMYRPKKIVELGVAEGATTCIIMNTLRILGESAEVHSVDLNESLYYDSTKYTGYQYVQACEAGCVDNCNHQFHIGKYLPEMIDEIGEGIDFIILDTVHKAPGELMDLLVCLPYLSPNAVICFHDTLYCYGYDTGDRARHINMLCFNVLRGIKYMNLDKKENSDYESIGAIEINEETMKGVEDLFMLFCFPWFYLPSDKEIQIYQKKYMQLYGKYYAELFAQYVEMNAINIGNNINCYKENHMDQLISFCKKENLFLYGTGSRGRVIYEYLTGLGCAISGFVVSDGYKEMDCFNQLPVFELSEVERDANIIITSSFPEVEENLKKNKRSYYNPSSGIVKQAKRWVELKKCIVT